MSNHHGPECVAPDYLRCEAQARANPGYFYRWAEKDRRCSKKAYQFRDRVLVCHVHAKSKILTKWSA